MPRSAPAGSGGRAEIDLDGAGHQTARRLQNLLHTTPANTYAAMHYNIIRLAKPRHFRARCHCSRMPSAVLTHPRARARRPLFAGRRDTRECSRRGNRQQHAVLRVEWPSLPSRMSQPGVPTRANAVGAVYLMRQHGRRKARAECRPGTRARADDLPHRLVTPQSKTERPCRMPATSPWRCAHSVSSSADGGRRQRDFASSGTGAGCCPPT